MSVLALLPIWNVAGAEATPPAARRVHVVAFKNSRLFTCCPPEERSARGADSRRLAAFQLPDGWILALPMGTAASPIGPYADLFRITRPIMGRFGPPQADGTLKQAIEEAIAKEAKRELAASPEEADAVLLVEGLYLPGRSSSRGMPTAAPGGPTVDEKSIFRAACLAVEVPVAALEKKPFDGPSLLAASTWAGAAYFRTAGSRLVPASPEELVQQYLSGKTRSGRDPLRLCAVPPLHGSPDGVWRSARPAPPNLRGGRTEAREPAAAASSRPADPAAIRVDVSLVSVPVIVSDAQGRFLPGLGGSDFRLFEDGVEQKMDAFLPADEPFHVVLLMDTSGSTRFKHSEIQQAALEFVRTLRPGDRLMVVSFDSRIYLDSEFTGDAGRLRDAVMQTRLGNNTRLHDALLLVVEDQLRTISGRKAVVVFSDGVDNASRMADAAATLSLVQESDVMVYAVQYDTGGLLAASAGRSLYPKEVYERAAGHLRELAEASGGRCFPAGTLEGIRAAFAQVAEELRRQYTLLYYPSRPAGDGSFRSIRVEVDVPGARVRSRKGYRPSGAPARQPSAVQGR